MMLCRLLRDKRGSDAPTNAQCGRVGPSVRPALGDALLFWSTFVNGTTDEASMHGSCPVLRGTKWTATLWMHAAPFHETLD